MMHSKSFDIQKKQQKTYAIKSTIRDAKTILMFYRVCISLFMFFFAFVISKILELNRNPYDLSVGELQIKYSFTAKIIAIIATGM